MPTYRYRCAKCGDEQEIWQSFEDKPLARHNGGCGGKLDKVMSPAGIVLKGSGFYKTDNRSSSKSGSPNGRDKDSGSSDSKSSSSESKASESKASESKASDSKSDSKGPSSSSKKEATSTKS